MKPKVVVIGIDSAEPNILFPLANQKYLPNLFKLMKTGLYSPLNSCPPYLTPPCWETSVSGVNPGKHNIFDFIQYNNSSYLPDVVDTEFRKAKRVWELLSNYNIKVGILNYPLGFPPDSVNGFFISGRGTPNVKQNFTYPVNLKRELLSKFPDYRFDINKKYYRENDAGSFIDEALYLINKEAEIASYLLKNKEWDFFMTVFMSLDRMQHFFFNKKHIIETFYRKIDEAIGLIIAPLLNIPDLHILLYSDHGMHTINKEISAYSLLEKQGLLRIRKKMLITKKYFELKKIIKKIVKDKSFVTANSNINTTDLPFFDTVNDVDWSKTAIYFGSVGPQSFRINLKGREIHGIVHQSEYNRLRQSFKNKLLSLRDGNKKIIKKVHFREDIFYGSYADNADDIYVEPADGYHFRNNYGYQKIIYTPAPSQFNRTGEHSHQGLIIYNGLLKNKVRLKNATLADICPTVLDLFKVPIPRSLDGKSLITPASKESELTPKISENLFHGKPTTADYDKESLMDNLRALGYW